VVLLCGFGAGTDLGHRAVALVRPVFLWNRRASSQTAPQFRNKGGARLDETSTRRAGQVKEGDTWDLSSLFKETAESRSSYRRPAGRHPQV
jgi:hypothetical protein